MNYIDLYNDGSQSPLFTTRGMDIWLFLETFTVVTVARGLVLALRGRGPGTFLGTL